MVISAQMPPQYVGSKNTSNFSMVFATALATTIGIGSYIARPFEKRSIDGQPAPKIQAFFDKISPTNHQGRFVNRTELREITFDKQLVDLYGELLAGQQPLGVEFEQVLYANLWDLYDES